MTIEENDSANKVLCTKPAGNAERRRDKPTLRWCDELEEDVVLVGRINRRINLQPREKWWKVIEEVKSHPRMYSQWKKKDICFR